jgi:hypothetical protein
VTRAADAWVATTEVTRRYLVGDLEGALGVTEKLVPGLPDRFASLSSMRAKLLVELGRPGQSASTVTHASRWTSGRPWCLPASAS